MFCPLGSKVLVLPDTAKEKTTKGGIILLANDGTSGGAKMGIVVKVGPGTLIDGEVRPVPVKEGDRVVFGKYAGSTKMTIDEKEHVLLDASEILGTDA